VLKQAREVRELSAIDAARAARISAAYLSRLENDAVKRPSPHVLHQLSEALAVPYTELMRLSGYRVPGESNRNPTDAVSAALFGDLTEDERDELLEYLAWYRARRRAKTGVAARGDERLRQSRTALGQDELAPRSVKPAGPDGRAPSSGARP
jgi:transcriptional regulator with XRE-family HTH domain